jgi:mannose-1-phosphate guanylyltransferase/mannose-1-phosphate guanylyltransferase/mannose-6-phosphate isomerase
MDFLSHRDHEDRPWGAFDRFTLNESSTVKLLTLHPNERLSLQRHAKRSEFWRIIRGSGTAEVGGESVSVSEGSEVDIPTGVAHRLTAGAEGLSWLEIALGHFDEHDEERLADDFGRTSPS